VATTIFNIHDLAVFPAWCKHKSQRSSNGARENEDRGHTMSLDRSLTEAEKTRRNLSHALAPYLRRVAVCDGLEKRGVISKCIVSGSCAPFAIIAMQGCMCGGYCSGAPHHGAEAGP
jgi:hypothetical protein